MTAEEYFGDWTKVLNVKEAEETLKITLKSGNKICPASKDVFKAFRLCPLKNLRVLVLGQDPYFNTRNGKPVATGIAFANSTDTLEEDYSPSLNIIKESVIDFTLPHQRIIFDQSLEKWEEQGVLLLNTALTCIEGRPSSHTLLWRPFIKSLLTNLSKHTTGIVYVLMGNSAGSFEDYIDIRFNHVLKTLHPAYYARTKTNMPSDVWREINKILIGQNGYGIEWYKELNF
jgi:uracil-DNA glycosylase